MSYRIQEDFIEISDLILKTHGQLTKNKCFKTRHHFANISRRRHGKEFGGPLETKSAHALSNGAPFKNFHRRKWGGFVATTFEKGHALEALQRSAN